MLSLNHTIGRTVGVYFVVACNAALLSMNLIESSLLFYFAMNLFHETSSFNQHIVCFVLLVKLDIVYCISYSFSFCSLKIRCYVNQNLRPSIVKYSTFAVTCHNILSPSSVLMNRQSTKWFE